MNRLVVKSTLAYSVNIFIGCDDVLQAEKVARNFCDVVGLCVTVTPTTYVYKGGSCMGVIVGLINYARFPKEQHIIRDTATSLAFLLKEELKQGSFTIQDHQTSTFYSTRDEDQ